MNRWLDSLQPWGATLLRLVLGVAMVYNGHGKIIPAGGLHAPPLSAVEHYSRYIGSLGIPAWLGYVSAATEFFGGILVLLGLLTRFAAFMVAGNMLVALFSVNLHHGYSGSEYTLALIAMAVMLLCTGGGALALDRRIGLA